MSNSPLVSYTRISPNRNSPRTQKISKITIHHMAGVMSVEGFGEIVSKESRGMSANYAIGSDARVGLFCPEEDRSWCSSSPWNDHRAVTIEVSNSACTPDWPIADHVWAKLIDLCVDICKRNNIPKLTFTGDQNGSLTFHYYFSSTCCPGPFIKSRAQQICDQVNARLNNNTNTKPAESNPIGVTNRIEKDCWVKIKPGSKYWNGQSIPSWVMDDVWRVSEVSGKRAVLGANDEGNRNIQSPINVDCLINIKAATSESFTAYTKTFKKGTTIYKTPGKTDKAGVINKDGVYTIIEEQKVNKTLYGKLKSGAGYVVISGTAPDMICVGDTVKVLSNKQYNGMTFKIYQDTYKVLSINNDRVVISADGKNVTAAVNKNNLQKV